MSEFNQWCKCDVCRRSRGEVIPSAGAFVTGDTPNVNIKPGGINYRPAGMTATEVREFGAKTSAYAPSILPTASEERKRVPVATGCLDYFPAALAAIAALSRIGNDKHNPGQPLHWSRGKSDDHPDCLIRHFLERGKMDTVNGERVRHSTQMAWRALAILQLEIEEAEKTALVVGMY